MSGDSVNLEPMALTPAGSPGRTRRLAGVLARRTAVASLVIAIGIAGCGGSAQPPASPASALPTSAAPAGAPSPSAAPEPIPVAAAFYPLQFLAERVGGDCAVVSGVAPAGAEAHDLELGPREVAMVEAAEVVLWIPGIMPVLDDLLAGRSGTAVDVTAAVDLHEVEEGHDEAEHDHGGTDVHVWLDPVNMSTMAALVSERFSALRPECSDTIAANTSALQAELADLDAQWQAGTAECRSRDLVTAHAAFGYLADRYGLTQRAISGLRPEAEPSPATIAEIADYVSSNGVETIYYEVLVDPAVAEVIAAETGARTARLDPIESLPVGSPGDYLTIMRENLAAVRAGNGCS